MNYLVLPQVKARNNQSSQIKSVQKYLADVELRQVDQPDVRTERAQSAHPSAASDRVALALHV